MVPALAEALGKNQKLLGPRFTLGELTTLPHALNPWLKTVSQ